MLHLGNNSHCYSNETFLLLLKVFMGLQPQNNIQVPPRGVFNLKKYSCHFIWDTNSLPVLP